MKIYVVRHGETDWNKARKMQGQTDIELNEIGIKQAEELKRNIDKYNFDSIICSPLKRARKTAQIINKDLNKPIIYCVEIIERCYGEYEGVIRDTFDYARFWNYNENYEYKEVEKMKDFFNRIWKFLDRIKEEYSNNILIVCHGGVMRAIDTYFNKNYDTEYIVKALPNNCEVKEYEF